MTLFKRRILNLMGWHTQRKIIVFQSDDWGSIRMPSIKVQQNLGKHSQIDLNTPYNQFDTLASQQDLEALYDVLVGVKDVRGNHAVITANCVMANPDFVKIKSDNFENYYFEKIQDTFRRYDNDSALKVWDVGLKMGVFIPQFHGREHVNVPIWLAHLKAKHQGVLYAFDHGVFGANFKGLVRQELNFQRAWDYNNIVNGEVVKTSIKEGIQLFKKQFNFTPTTAVAPAYCWSKNQEEQLWELGVKTMQGIPYQFIPNGNGSLFNKKIRVTMKPSKKMGYQMRNAFFEPSLYPNINHVGTCISRIQEAFDSRKPAIIGSHRLNFVGGLSEKNRTNNLKTLSDLLEEIVNRWPEVEFMSSDILLNTDNVALQDIS